MTTTTRTTTTTSSEAESPTNGLARFSRFIPGWLTRRRALLALPFVLGPLVVRLFLPLIARKIAAAIIAAAPPPPAGPPPDGNVGTLEPAEELSEDQKEKEKDWADGRIIVLGGPLPHKPPKVDTEDAGAAPSLDGGVSRGTIFIPASMVTLALEKKDIHASNALGLDNKPFGARIHGVSKYPVGLRNNDVIVFVEGMRTETTAALIEAAVKAVAAGATKLNGKIVRGDESWDVVLELPPRDELPKKIPPAPKR